MAEGGCSPEGGVPTYKPIVEDTIRTIEPDAELKWKAAKKPDWAEKNDPELKWEADKKPDWFDPKLTDADRKLEPPSMEDTLKKLAPEPKVLGKGTDVFKKSE